jgi:nitrate reductase NapE component
MKRKPTRKKTDYDLSFCVLVLWPLIVMAIVGIGFLVPALVKAL